MNLLPYYPTYWDRATLEITGLLVIALSVVALALLVARRDTLAVGAQALADGLCIGLAGALACGVTFLTVQSHVVGPVVFQAPYDMRAGLAYGIGLGALAALAVAACITRRSAAMVGLLLGAAVGLVAFRLYFGPSAGFGNEIGQGVGAEVGILFGTAGGLLGGIIASVIALIARRPRPQPTGAESGEATLPSLGWYWPPLGLLLGGLGGALFGALGVYMGIFQFLVPYYAQTPDVPPDTSPAGMLRDTLFGLGVFAIAGALIGCFLVLQWLASPRDTARRRRVWLGVGLIIALICGLSFGLNYRAVGVPLHTNPLIGFQLLHPDPAGGGRGLLIGLVGGGVVAGALRVPLARLDGAHPRWRTAARTAFALAAGVLVMTLPLWYASIFGTLMY